LVPARPLTQRQQELVLAAASPELRAALQLMVHGGLEPADLAQLHVGDVAPRTGRVRLPDRDGRPRRLDYLPASVSEGLVLLAAGRAREDLLFGSVDLERQWATLAAGLPYERLVATAAAARRRLRRQGLPV
jgi:integrase